MKVYKFGGASVKDAEGIKNLTKIVAAEADNLIIVVSAFGKTTNALEKVLGSCLDGNKNYKSLLDDVYAYHSSVITDLFDQGSDLRGRLEISFALLRNYLLTTNSRIYDYDYDQVVSYGEIWSTMIVAEFLKKSNLNAEWCDIRENLMTDDTYRDANVLWAESNKKLHIAFDFSKNKIFVTQGFIGGTAAGDTTTLGREGSDYTAAILANMFDAECLVVWKDVPGILNADPKWLPGARKMDEISYKEAVEMSFSGAKVIHPKTIKPLHNKSIPLYVKSFLAPAEYGTIIKADATLKEIMPVFIMKEKQILISITPVDFSFVMGDNLSKIFHTFIKHGIKVNLVEASAVNIDVCVDDDRGKISKLISDLKIEYSAVYNDKIEMLTIRHYTPEAIKQVTEGREILLEQRTRSMVRFVVREDPSVALRHLP